MSVENARRLLLLPRAFDAKEHSNKSAVDTGSVSLVQQHLGEEADINTIVRRFGVTGQFPVASAEGVYGDFTGITDYESAVAAVESARRGFLALPAEVRDKFGNDPGKLLEFADGMDADELDVKLGLRPEVKVVVPTLAPVAPVAP